MCGSLIIAISFGHKQEVRQSKVKWLLESSTVTREEAFTDNKCMYVCALRPHTDTLVSRHSRCCWWWWWWWLWSWWWIKYGDRAVTALQSSSCSSSFTQTSRPIFVFPNFVQPYANSHIASVFVCGECPAVQWGLINSNLNDWLIDLLTEHR